MDEMRELQEKSLKIEHELLKLREQNEKLKKVLTALWDDCTNLLIDVEKVKTKNDMPTLEGTLRKWRVDKLKEFLR